MGKRAQSPVPNGNIKGPAVASRTRMAAHFLKGKRCLVTGGTGTVGRWVVREMLRHEPEVVRVLDVDETGLFEFAQELGGYTDGRTRFLVADVRDKERMVRATEQIDVVVHCAALKHVELCEYNPFEAVKTNILGVQSLIEACLDNEVDRVLLTSSDKAANPSNTMGATKLVGEKLIVAANYAKGPRRTKFGCVRFGNVMGSRGSMIPLFRRQILEGGPVTMTDPAMTRFVLTQSEAIHLVFEALERMVGGEVFVPRMPSVRIKDLVDVMVRTMANGAGKRAAVKTIGVKPGEKIYEELITDEEATRTYQVGDLLVILSPVKESLSAEALAYTRHPKPKKGRFTSHDVKKMSGAEIGRLLKREGLV